MPSLKNTRHSSSDIPQITSEAIYSNEVSFSIIDSKKFEHHTYGETIIFTVELDIEVDELGTKRNLFMSATQDRNAIHNDFQSGELSFRNPLTDCKLAQVPSKKYSTPAWIIVPADDYEETIDSNGDNIPF